MRSSTDLSGYQFIHREELESAPSPEDKLKVVRKIRARTDASGHTLITLDDTDTLEVLQVCPGFDAENPCTTIYRAKVAKSESRSLVNKELYLFQKDLDKTQPKPPAMNKKVARRR